MHPILFYIFDNFYIGTYGIYELLLLLIGVFHILLIGMILKMKPIKEKPVGEVFKEVINENLMKIRDVIARPP